MTRLRFNTLLRRLRGFSLVETLVAISLMALMFGTFGYLILSTTRDANRQTAFLRSQFRALHAMDVLKPYVQPARYQSITVSNEGRRIDFNNPWISESGYSALIYDSTNGLRYADPVVTGGAWESILLFDIEDVVFTLEQSDSILAIDVTAPATYAGKDAPYTVTAKMRVRSFGSSFDGSDANNSGEEIIDSDGNVKKPRKGGFRKGPKQ